MSRAPSITSKSLYTSDSDSRFRVGSSRLRPDETCLQTSCPLAGVEHTIDLPEDRGALAWVIDQRIL